MTEQTKQNTKTIEIPTENEVDTAFSSSSSDEEVGEQELSAELSESESDFSDEEVQVPKTNAGEESWEPSVEGSEEGSEEEEEKKEGGRRSRSRKNGRKIGRKIMGKLSDMLSSDGSSSSDSDEEVRGGGNDSDDGASYTTTQVLEHDPLYFVLSRLFISSKTNRNIAEILEDLTATVKAAQK